MRMAKIHRDILWYFKVRHKFTFSPKFNRDSIIYDSNGLSSLDAYVSYDSLGKLLPTKHPRTLKSLIATKGSVNFQIQEWANALVGGYLVKCELEDYLSDIKAPSWVLQAVQRQRYSEKPNLLMEKVIADGISYVYRKELVASMAFRFRCWAILCKICTNIIC